MITGERREQRQPILAPSRITINGNDPDTNPGPGTDFQAGGRVQDGLQTRNMAPCCKYSWKFAETKDETDFVIHTYLNPQRCWWKVGALLLGLLQISVGILFAVTFTTYIGYGKAWFHNIFITLGCLIGGFILSTLSLVHLACPRCLHKEGQDVATNRETVVTCWHFWSCTAGILWYVCAALTAAFDLYVKIELSDATVVDARSGAGLIKTDVDCGQLAYVVLDGTLNRWICGWFSQNWQFANFIFLAAIPQTFVLHALPARVWIIPLALELTINFFFFLPAALSRYSYIFTGFLVFFAVAGVLAVILPALSIEEARRRTFSRRKNWLALRDAVSNQLGQSMENLLGPELNSLFTSEENDVLVLTNTADTLQSVNAMGALAKQVLYHNVRGNMLLPPGSITNIRELTGGTQANVFTGQLVDEGGNVVAEGGNVALKMYGDDVDNKKMVREAAVLMSLDHLNIVWFKGLWQDVHGTVNDKKCTFLVNEYCDGGTLFDRLFQNPPSVEQKELWCRQCADAVHFLHSRRDPVPHRDIKAANVGIKNGMCKLVCGTSQSSPDTCSVITRPYVYLRPRRWTLARHTREGLTDTLPDQGARFTMRPSPCQNTPSQPHDDTNTKIIHTHAISMHRRFASDRESQQVTRLKGDIYSLGILFCLIFNPNSDPDSYGFHIDFDFDPKHYFYDDQLSMWKIFGQKVRDDDLRPQLGDNNPLSDLVVKMWNKRPSQRPEAKDVLGELTKP